MDGALALALPCIRGQRLQVSPSADALAHWRALNEEGEAWFTLGMSWPGLEIVDTDQPEAARRLQELLRTIDQLRPDFLATQPPATFTTWLEFPREWGLGSSSTLISLLAQWSAVDPFRLSDETFGGSGYDLACANARGPLLYRRKNGRPYWVEVPYRPEFSDQLYLVYQGQKQDSREGIRHYREKAGREGQELVAAFDRLSWQWVQARNLEECEQVIETHEQRLSEILQLPRVKEQRFPDFWGSVKSLGAWGGDFVLATSRETEAATRLYFGQRGYANVFRWGELVL